MQGILIINFFVNIFVHLCKTGMEMFEMMNMFT